MALLREVRRRRGTIAVTSILAGLVLVWAVPAIGAPEAVGQAGTKQRTFVATAGSDANSCGATDPCRTFSRAIAETAAGGEVLVLTSGGYGTFTIDKSISIVARGVYAGVTATTGTALRITIAPTDKVFLRGLTFKGAGAGNGIWATGGGQVTISDCVVSNFISYGDKGGINYSGGG